MTMARTQPPCQLMVQHPPLHILGGCRRPRHHPAHCLPISAISSVLWLLATIFVLQQVIMDTTDVKSTGGTKSFISVWTAACDTQRPVDAGRHSKYCNSSVICRHNAVLWNVKWEYIDSRISNQAADGLLAGDDGFWNGRELTSDPVESFASVKPLAGDSVERFYDSRGRGALHTAPVEAPAHLDINFDSFLFDSAPAYINAGIADDGFITSSLACSAAGDTVMDTMSDDRCRSHSATQRGFALILDLQKPQFIWEQNNFLGAVFEKGNVVADFFPHVALKRPAGKGNVVDDPFPHVSLKRPASWPVDLTSDEMEEVPIQKALRRGQFKALYSRTIKRGAVVHEETQRANFMAGWTSVVRLNFLHLQHPTKLTVRVWKRSCVQQCTPRWWSAYLGKPPARWERGWVP